MRMSAECKWSRLAPALGGRHWSGYKLVFGEMLTLLYDFWFDRLTDVTRYAALMHQWAFLVQQKVGGASPRIIGFSALRLVGTSLPTPTLHMRKAPTSCADSNGTCSTLFLCASCRP